MISNPVSVEDEEELLTERELLRLPPFRKLKLRFGRLRRKGLVPYVRLGHKSYLYRPSAVLAAIRSMEQQTPTPAQAKRAAALKAKEAKASL
jgi:hypothetical protein